MTLHGYSYAEGMSTAVVELDETTWRRAFAPDGRSQPVDAPTLDRLAELFGEHLGGHALVGNQSPWSRFPVVENARWSHGNSVLLGDAAHTAQFTVGSGAKLAIEDAAALAVALGRHDELPAAFAACERD